MSSTNTAVAVSAARHAVHELLVELPSWDADDAREAISRLEQAIEQHIRAQVALEIETTAEANRQGLLPRPKPGHGDRLNDWQWAAAIARHADDTTSKEA